jgi:serine/threonine protein phosphatase PrpC
MPWWTWIALVFFAVVVAGGTAIALTALLRMRRLGATGDSVALALADLTHKTEELERRLDHANERAELVERKIAELNASMERLSVLTWALGDVAKTVSYVRSAVMLRK